MNEHGLDYRPFDADNHYYEALDAFTRHLDPKLGERVIQWAEVGGRRYHVIGGRVNHAVINPTFDPIAPPGALMEYFRGNPEGRGALEYLRQREPIPAPYRDRDARLALMDRQGLSAVWMFPTLGVLYEEPLKHDPEAVGMLTWAFNRWLDEDWGFAYQDRIFAAPYLSLADLDVAVEQLEWALSRGARTVCLRAAAPTTAHGRRRPADPMFDPFWARVHEAGVTVVVHAGDSGHSGNGYFDETFDARDAYAQRPTLKMLVMERAIFDWLASVVFDDLFVRFPHLRVASVENGSDFLPELCRKFRSVARKLPHLFPVDPLEIFREHVWINPFGEDDVGEVVDLMGPDRVLFGSDWPHIEGLRAPLDYVNELKAFDDVTRRKILLDNVTELTAPRAAP